MQMLERETSTPLPRIIGFSSTTENNVGCTFSLMTFICGIRLYDVWHGHHVLGLSKEEVLDHRKHELDSIAAPMAQLGKFSFPRGGRLAYNDFGNLMGVEDASSVSETESGSNAPCTAPKLVLPEQMKDGPEYRFPGSWLWH